MIDKDYRSVECLFPLMLCDNYYMETQRSVELYELLIEAKADVNASWNLDRMLILTAMSENIFSHLKTLGFEGGDDMFPLLWYLLASE